MKQSSPDETNLLTGHILIVDDEPLIGETLAEYLAQEGFQTTVCRSGEVALQKAESEPFDMALCDVRLPGIDGLELLRRLLQLNPEMGVLLMTAYATVDNAVEAFQRGAHDYLLKPIRLDEVLTRIQRFLAHRDLYLENQWLRRELNRNAPDGPLILGTSPAMQRVHEMVRKVAPTRSTVLITGESGTGKELVARAIHEASRDRPGRFVAVNCAAIPHDLLESQLFGHRRGSFTGADRDQPGLFAHAGSGTIFLDEIGEMPLPTQATLLRAIEQKEVLPVGAHEPVKIEARVLAATNKNLGHEVELGRFREDLYYRLNVVCIPVPPLRERREDIPALVEHLLARHVRELGKHFQGVEREAMQRLVSWRWRGNVRELQNVLERAVILGDGPLIGVADLPPDLVPQVEADSEDNLRKASALFEKQHIERILRQTPDKEEAARRLGIGLSSLYRKIAELHVQTP
jgi:DNA-binding NtrC family response regulator